MILDFLCNWDVRVPAEAENSIFGPKKDHIGKMVPKNRLTEQPNWHLPENRNYSELSQDMGKSLSQVRLRQNKVVIWA